MVQFRGLRYSGILKEDLWQRWLVKNQRSATQLGGKEVIKNTRLKISQQITSLVMTQVLELTARLKDKVMSDILWFDK